MKENEVIKSLLDNTGFTNNLNAYKYDRHQEFRPALNSKNIIIASKHLSCKIRDCLHG